jgi:hypothetical protein
MRRCELAGARRDLLNLDTGTLAIEITRVVIEIMSHCVALPWVTGTGSLAAAGVCGP